MKTLSIVIVALSLTSLCKAATTLTLLQANASSAVGLEIDGTLASNITINTQNTRFDDANNNSARRVTHTIENLDFDGDLISDTLTFVVAVTSTDTFGSSQLGNVSRSNSNGSFGVNSSNDTSGQLDLAGEELTFTLESASVIYSSGATPSAFTEQGFKSVSFRSYGNNARHLLNGLEANANLTNDASDLVSISSAFSVTSSESSSDRFRVRDYTVTITTPEAVVPIPEPASQVFLMLGLTTLLCTRRRSHSM
ncbi:hypothetical protein ACFSW8_00310 [Rubritalea tangerina]|uniref:PEP-CTERM sorting domain-containing protein n=2 Tax=Rubritalea tangerina TaxID=430798 RepID=A0ABW4Z638_9BACT